MRRFCRINAAVLSYQRIWKRHQVWQCLGSPISGLQYFSPAQPIFGKQSISPNHPLALIPLGVADGVHYDKRLGQMKCHNFARSQSGALLHGTIAIVAGVASIRTCAWSSSSRQIIWSNWMALISAAQHSGTSCSDLRIREANCRRSRDCSLSNHWSPGVSCA